MSYTNETTHYGIPLPLGTDKTTPMDYNESMQEVDTVLFGAKSNSDSALRKAQQVEAGLSQTDDNVTAIAGRVTTLEGTSVTHGNAIQQNAQDIADVRADALDMIEAKDEGTAQVATVAVNKGEYFRYNDVLYIATQNIAVGATIVPNTNCRATNIGTELEEIRDGLGARKIIKTVTGNSSTTMSALINSIYTETKNLADAGKEFLIEIDGTSWGYLNCRYANRNAENTIYNMTSTFFFTGVTISYGISVRSTGSKVEDYNPSAGTPHTDYSSNSSAGITIKLFEII